MGKIAESSDLMFFYKFNKKYFNLAAFYYLTCFLPMLIFSNYLNVCAKAPVD